MQEADKEIQEIKQEIEAPAHTEKKTEEVKKTEEK